ncbi:MAG: hypothetical protein K8T26_03125 [Lentisphaerae bacterium]|nr:hypothetical protein [Lentisphaerota bacterium]
MTAAFAVDAFTVKTNAQAPRVALLVDNPFRDLPGIVLVARALARRGVCCLLVPMNLRNAELWPLVPDFVLLNHVRRVYGSLASDLVTAGIRIGVLETEGGIYSPAASEAGMASGDENQDLDEFAVSMLQDEAIRATVDPFCAWSARFAARAADKAWFPREHLAVTGVPRMDLYAAPWTAAALQLVPEAAGYARNLVLINSTFPLANAAFQTPEKELDLLCKEFGYTPEYGARAMAAQREGMAGLTALANQLAEAYPQATFVYRPHPFEGEDVYLNLLKALPNLHLVKKGTVNGWLLRARALIQLGSSTAIDATLAGIPAFTPGWLTAFPPLPAVDAISLRCASPAEMVRQIGAVLAGTFVMPGSVKQAIASVVERTFYRIDGKAHERVADAILSVLSRPGPGPSLSHCQARTHHAPDPTRRGRVVRQIRQWLGIGRSYRGHEQARQRAVAWAATSKRFDLRDVQRILSALDAAARTAGETPLALRVMDAGGGAYRLPHATSHSVVVQAA